MKSKVHWVHSGPWANDDGDIWLVVKSECDERGMIDEEISFDNFTMAYKFKQQVNEAMEPVELDWGEIKDE